MTAGVPVPAAKVVDAEVYIEYLKGRHHWRRDSEPGVRKAIEHFDAALARDPEYAPAHAGLAICHLGLGWLGAVIPHRAFPVSKASALRALAIDDTLAEAYCALGYIATFYEWNWDDARRALARALALQPGASDAHLFQAWFHNAIGDHEAANAETRRALELDPLSRLCLGNAGYLAIFDRRYEDAERFVRQALELDRSHLMDRWTLGIALTCQRRYDEAIAEFEEVVRSWEGVSVLGWLGYASALAGRRARAQELLAKLQAVAPEQAVQTEIARILVALGDHDGALTALAFACDAREGGLGYLGSEPCWDVIADDDRFKTILRRRGLSARSRPLATGMTAPIVTEVAGKSLVVLPFTNLSPDADDEYFSDGLTEELIADLSKVRALRVISRASAMRLKGTAKDSATLGRELDVRYVLTGSVRKSVGALRITAELADAATNTVVWAEKYSGTLADVFELQERVSREIVGALDVTLSDPEWRQLTHHAIGDPAAYDCYLRARHEIYRWSPASLDRATQLLNQGLAIVGGSPMLRAYLGLADVVRFRLGAASGEDPLARAEAQAREIVASTPDSALAWTLQGQVAFERGQLQEAVRHLKRTLALEPSNVDAMFWLGACYVHAGRTEAATRLMSQVVKADPLFASGWGLKAALEWFDGRFADAVPGMTRALELDPESQQLRWMSGYTLALNGRIDDAAEVANRLRRDDPDFPYTRQLAALVAAKRGRHVAALDELAPLERIPLDAHLSLHVAESYAAAGDADRALALLRRAVEHGFHPFAFIATHGPFFEGLRRDARFERIVAEARARCERFEE